jgi:hypothetical protein
MGLPVKGLIGPSLGLVREARLGAWPDGSMSRTFVPSRRRIPNAKSAPSSRYSSH